MNRPTGSENQDMAFQLQRAVTGSSVLRAAAAPCLLLAIGIALQWPWLDVPFGPTEINGGYYFGPFANTYRDFGFWELRGVPVGRYGLQPLGEGLASLNHPPGLAWLCGFGTKEWQIRLAPAIGQVLASMLLWALLRKRLGGIRAFGAGLMLLVLPVLTLYGRVSHEPVVLALGMATVVVFLRAVGTEGPASRGSWILLGSVSFLGLWIDWAFAFWIAALAIFVLDRGRRGWRTLIVPWGSMTASLAAIHAWKAWAREAPLLAGMHFAETTSAVKAAVSNRPPLGRFLESYWDRILEGFPGLFLAVAVAGAWFLFRKDLRLAAVLLVPPIVTVILVPGHASTHASFSGYFAPVLAAAAVSVPAPRWRWGRLLPAAAILAALVSGVTATLTALDRSTTPVFRQIGEILDDASLDEPADGRTYRAYRVWHNLPLAYPYYIRSPLTREAVFRRDEVERALANVGDPLGLRFLLCKFDIPEGHLFRPSFPPTSELETWLSRFPSRRIPALEQVIPHPASPDNIVLTECRLYELRP